MPDPSPMILAHAGDWISSTIMVSPVALVLGWLVIITVRDRRKGIEYADEDDDPRGSLPRD